MIPASQALWPLASAAAALAFLISRPWRRPRGRMVTGLVVALLAVDAAILFAGATMPTAVAPLSAAAALLLIGFGATASLLEDSEDGEPLPSAPRPVPRPSPCDNSQLLQWAVDQGEPALAVSRFDGEMVFVNVAWARLHGLRPHEVVGHRWSLFHSPEQMATEFRPMMTQAEADGSHDAVVGRRRPDGTTFTSRTRLSLVYDPETSAAIGWMAVAWPVASAVDAEPAAGARGEAHPALDGAGIAFGRRVREAAHDFNNLLSAVVGNAGLILEQVGGDPELQREVEEIESAAMRAAELATRLQTEARLIAPPSMDEPAFHSTSIEPAEAPTTPPETLPSMPVEDAATVEDEEDAGDATILVVDNEKIVRDLARSVLEIRGYRVVLAKDGSSAVELFEAHRHTIRAVLLDFGMPGMDGREVFGRLRAIDPTVRVVLMTGFRDRQLLDEMERDGLADSLPKPFRPAQLTETLERVIALQ